ncbi:hypothetical protein OH460_08325 [Vibrio sp. Makdt]|uniref:hypothetical protein n=1 Tax=Vibrio sp. Makdt TaxID=2998828 RepID=UPI0022CD423F|nr:hypothetical protein [Vibrio sp. Makdt]MDA0152305.1 hypothetical protein [Vibrio sp. Makdt]
MTKQSTIQPATSCDTDQFVHFYDSSLYASYLKAMECWETKRTSEDITSLNLDISNNGLYETSDLVNSMLNLTDSKNIKAGIVFDIGDSRQAFISLDLLVTLNSVQHPYYLGMINVAISAVNGDQESIGLCGDYELGKEFCVF